MTDNQRIQAFGRILGVGALSLAANYFISKYLVKGAKDETIQDLRAEISGQQLKLNESRMRRKRVSIRQQPPQDLQKWGSVKVLAHESQDTLLIELKMMTLISCEVIKINNLIIDLENKDFRSFPCPLVAHQTKKKKNQPFLMEEALVQPCSFVIKNCVFKSGQTIQYQRKFLRAGPRATQYFDPSRVRADIVPLGQICPGFNTVIRQLTLSLCQIYKVKSVTGIKQSFEGYYNNKMIDLTPEKVQTIHHFGGCFLGTCKADFHPDKIIASLVRREINQVYLIGAYHTLLSAKMLYEQIKKRKLQIAVCVIVKAYKKQIPIVDVCFGYESAIQETQRFVQAAFNAASSYRNCVTLVKVPGIQTGYLAMDACRAARNVNICLVPEFAYDIHGENGLLKYITERVKHKGSCKIVYSQGSHRGARDIQYQMAKKCEQDIKNNSSCGNYFGIFLKSQIEKQLQRINLKPNTVILFDSVETIKAVPANSFDTKLCCQLASASISGLMCGYTNFVSGHLGLRNTWIPVQQMLSNNYAASLQPHDQNWQRLLAMTGQPSFINDEEQFVKIE